MGAVLRITAVIVMLGACGKDPRPATAPRERPDAAPSDAAGRADDAPACVAECTQRNAMRATSPEQIEADCRAECSAAPR